MIIECPHCEAQVDGKILGKKEWGPDDYGYPMKIVLLECPNCDSALLGYSEIEPTQEGWDWSKPKRLWPDPPESLHFSIPREVRRSLQDANKCFKSGLYSACAVMCGRAIEAICKEKVGAKALAKGLQKMKDEGIIDDKIWKWSNALREERNIGAHATGIDVTKENASDIVDFANAICEYVYVLTRKFDDYMARKQIT